MPTDRFLIRFDTNVTAAMAALDRLAAKITQIEARLNALGARAAGAGAFSGVTQGAAQAQAAVGGLAGAAQSATASVGALGAGTKPLTATAAAAKGAKDSLAQLALTARINAEQFRQFGNITAGRRALAGFEQLASMQTVLGRSSTKAAADAATLRNELGRIPGALTPIGRGLANTDNSFARHIHRIQETIFAYAAFFAAAAALQKSFTLATTVERESRRLEAVLDIGPEQAQRFIGGLADIAVETVTPLENLVSEADFMASAFTDIEDPVQRAAAALELANAVGKITTVTQRDVATETENVISIMKQANIPIEELGDSLGKIVVAGNNSSVAISAILDALQQSTAAASLAGVDFDTLIALIGRFRDITQRSGTEIGNTLKTLFQTITGTEAQNNLKELTNGMVDVFDEAGNLRSVTEIMADLVATSEKFPAIAAKLPEIFKALAPPLQPGAARDLQILFDVFKDLGPALDQVASAGEDSLDRLVTKINSALGPQFKQFIEEVKRGFIELFGPEIIATGTDLLNLLTGLRDVLGTIPGPVILIVAKFAAFVGILKAGSFVLKGIVALLGLGGVAGAAGIASRSMGGLVINLSALGAVFRRVLPLAAAFAAIEFGGGLIEAAQQIDNLERLPGISRELADDVVNINNIGGLTSESQRQRARDLFGITDSEFGEFPGAFADEELKKLRSVQFGILQSRANLVAENFEQAAQAIEVLKQSNQDTPENLKRLSEALLNTYESGQLTKISMEDLVNAALGVEETSDNLTNSWEQEYEAALKAAEGVSALTEQQRILAEAETIQLELADDVSSALETLSDRLRDGKISFEEYTQGVDQVTRASELAAQLVSAAGNELAKIPQLAGAAAEGNDALASAIFRMITSSTDQLPLIDQLITKIVGIAGAAAAAAATAAANPIVIRTIILPPTQVAAGGGIPEGAGDPGLGKPGGNFVRPFVSIGSSIGNIQDQVSRLVNDLIRQLVGGTSSSFGIGPSIGSIGGGGAGSTRRSTDILDIGDLKKSDIPKIIEIATRLRNRIPGARRESEGAIVALLKDARFLKTVRGIDDRLLRLAIERLTGQMEEANRREEEKARRDQILRNLVVRTGPLGALVSQPTAFGLGGNIAQGNGLNFDPTQGNFVINVPVELKGLEPKKLQELIYNIISKAIRDALRL